MYISMKRHSWFFKSWWCLLYFGHVQTRTIGKCWRQKTPFCLKLSAHAQWRQKPPFCLKLSTHAQKSVLSWSISMSRILACTGPTLGQYWAWKSDFSCVVRNDARALLSRILRIVNSDWLQPAHSVGRVYEWYIIVSFLVYTKLYWKWR